MVCALAGSLKNRKRAALIHQVRMPVIVPVMRLQKARLQRALKRKLRSNDRSFLSQVDANSIGRCPDLQAGGHRVAGTYGKTPPQLEAKGVEGGDIISVAEEVHAEYIRGYKKPVGVRKKIK